MKHERYNIFQKTHNRLGSLVFDAGTGIQRMDNCNPEEINIILEKIILSIKYFEYHIRREDCIIYSAVASIAPFIISEIEKTNSADLSLAMSIEREIENCYPYKGLSREREMSLRTSFFSYAAAVLQHINKEETVINQLLWDVYNDEQLKDLYCSLHDKPVDVGGKKCNNEELHCRVNIFENNSDIDMMLPVMDSVEAA